MGLECKRDTVGLRFNARRRGNGAGTGMVKWVEIWYLHLYRDSIKKPTKYCFKRLGGGKEMDYGIMKDRWTCSKYAICIYEIFTWNSLILLMNPKFLKKIIVRVLQMRKLRFRGLSDQTHVAKFWQDYYSK